MYSFGGVPELNEQILATEGVERTNWSVANLFYLGLYEKVSLTLYFLRNPKLKTLLKQRIKGQVTTD